MDTLLTKLTEVVNALNNLSVTNSSAARANATCGCPGGTTPPTQGTFVEGDPPPEGWEAPEDEVGSTEYQNRKCAIANLIHQWVVSSCEAWQNFGIDDIAAVVGAGGFAYVANALIEGFLVGAVFGWVVLVVGVVAAIATAFIYNSIDLSNIITILNANEDDFVCALYTSTSAAEAKANYLQIADDNGMSTGNYALLEAIFYVEDIFGQMFFNPTDPERAAALEAAIAGFSGGVDCGACACNEFVLLWGSYNSETGVLSSQPEGSGHTLAIMFNSSSWAYDWLTTQEANCGPMAIPEFGSITGGAPYTSVAFQVYNDVPSQIYVSSSVMWSNPGQHGRSFWITRNAAFTVPLIGFENYGG